MKYMNDFIELINELKSTYSWFVEPGRGDMHDVELYWIYVTIRESGIRHIYESNTYEGRSTAFFAHAVMQVGGSLTSASWPRVHSNLIEIQNHCDYFKILTKRGETSIKSFSWNDEYIAIVDGPKAGVVNQNEGWMQLMNFFMYPKQRPRYIFNHDMRREFRPYNYDAFMNWYHDRRAFIHYESKLIPKETISEALSILNEKFDYPKLGSVLDSEDTRLLAENLISNLCRMTRITDRGFLGEPKTGLM